MLNILALPFAVRLLGEQKLNTFDCQIDGYRPRAKINTFIGALGFNIFVGTMSAFMLAWFVLDYLLHHKKTKDRRTPPKRSPHFVDTCVALLMISTIIADWVLWGRKLAFRSLSLSIPLQLTCAQNLLVSPGKHTVLQTLSALASFGDSACFQFLFFGQSLAAQLIVDECITLAHSFLFLYHILGCQFFVKAKLNV